ncbi:MAG: zeta toxin family protein [Pseudomonadota bacterium]
MLDWDALYRERIHPAFAVQRGGVDAPRCIFVIGHQGSGKTTLLHRLLADLGPDQTQSVVPDALVARIDEVHGDSLEAKAAFDAYRVIHCATHCQLLADHAVAQRAHILWERAIPGNIERLAIALRQLGYQVECLVLATPVEESWLGALGRTLAALDAGETNAMRIGWPMVRETALRWPAVLDRIERDLTFDRVAIVDRAGEICFENHVAGPPEQRNWAETPFAFESLMVERARPRTEAALAALTATWKTLHPRLDAAGHPAWSAEDLQAFDDHLRATVADPASRFDLNAPGDDKAAAAAWIARLDRDLAAVRASPEVRDQPALAPRSARLLQLVAQVAGQPTR